jgi:UV DNA damage endonuclease
MIRLGLCCRFVKEPIKFHTTTVNYISKLTRAERRDKISTLCLANAHSLLLAIDYCHKNNIGSFRVSSRILPLKTHPNFGYDLSRLPQAKDITDTFKRCNLLAKKQDIRLILHPDPFVLLSSPHKRITHRAIQELEYQAEVSELIGVDVINIHGGGGYGDKKSALKRIEKVLKTLGKCILKRLTFENDDKVYTPADLLPFCEKNHLPFVYDVHHHRCLPDNLSVEQVTKMALKTWNREPVFHISSPKYGWKCSKHRVHHDYIHIKDFPDCWRNLDITVEVEAKAQELAVRRLQKQLKLETRH